MCVCIYECSKHWKYHRVIGRDSNVLSPVFIGCGEVMEMPWEKISRFVCENEWEPCLMLEGGMSAINGEWRKKKTQQPVLTSPVVSASAVRWKKRGSMSRSPLRAISRRGSASDSWN